MEQKPIFFSFIIIGAIIAIPFGLLALFNSSLAYAVVAGIGIGILFPSLIGVFLFGTHSKDPITIVESTTQTEIKSPNLAPVENVKTTNIPEEKTVLSNVKSQKSTESNTPNKIPSTNMSTIKSNAEFIQNVLKMGTIAQECQELVDCESELSKREKTRLFLKRDEFRKLYNDVKSSKFDSF